jgi:hypothetical protein
MQSSTTIGTGKSQVKNGVSLTQQCVRLFYSTGKFRPRAYYQGNKLNDYTRNDATDLQWLDRWISHHANSVSGERPDLPIVLEAAPILRERQGGFQLTQHQAAQSQATTLLRLAINPAKPIPSNIKIPGSGTLRGSKANRCSKAVKVAVSVLSTDHTKMFLLIDTLFCAE